MKVKIRLVESKLVNHVIEFPDEYMEKPITDSKSVSHLMSFLRNKPKEEFWTIHLDGKHYPFAIENVSIGTINTSLVHPREVFGSAVRNGSAGIIICHNHPSGDISPSSEDINVTTRLLESGKILGIPMLDHVIIGKDSYSFRTQSNLFS